MVRMSIRQIANLTFGNNTFDASNKNVQKTVHTFCCAKDEKILCRLYSKNYKEKEPVKTEIISSV